MKFLVEGWELRGNSAGITAHQSSAESQMLITPAYAAISLVCLLYLLSVLGGLIVRHSSRKSAR
jgi:hypothetical protein